MISSCKAKYLHSTLLPWSRLTLSQPPSPPVPTNGTRHRQTGNLNASQGVVAAFRESGTPARTHPSSHRKTGRRASEVSHEPAFSFPPQVPRDKVGLVPLRMKREGFGLSTSGPERFERRRQGASSKWLAACAHHRDRALDDGAQKCGRIRRHDTRSG